MSALSTIDLGLLSFAKKMSRFTNSWFGADNFFLAKTFIFISLVVASTTLKSNPYDLIWLIPGSLFVFILFSHRIDQVKRDGPEKYLFVLRKGLLLGNIFAGMILIVQYYFLTIDTIKDFKSSCTMQVAMIAVTFAHYFISYKDDPPSETWLSEKLKKRSRVRVSSTS